MGEENSGFNIDNYCDEIWESIFTNNVLCYKDIVNLSLSSKRLSKICLSDGIWKNLEKRRWGGADVVEWEDVSAYWLFKRRHIIESKLRRAIPTIGRETYNTDGISKCYVHHILSLVESEKETLLILKTLEYFAKNCSQELNLTYLSTKLYLLVNQNYLEKEWEKYSSYSSDDIYILERGAAFISKWCNQLKGNVCVEDVSKQLDFIAKRVSERLPKGSQKKSLENLFENELRAILDKTNCVLFKEMKFIGNRDAFYDINNSYIDKVLETRKGIPISLSVIYMAITKRLGLQPQSINFPGHFLIRFQFETSSGNTCYLYVDPFHQGEIMNKFQCTEKFSDVNTYGSDIPYDIMFPVADIAKVFIRQIANIINIHRRNYHDGVRHRDSLQSCLELNMLLAPVCVDVKLLLARIYLHKEINLDEVERYLQEMTSEGVSLSPHLFNCLLQAKQRITSFEIKPKLRSDAENSDVIYRIGMVVKHKRYHYNCVIYGWDPFCNKDESWKVQMGVYNLDRKDRQPYYCVLADDGTTRYAAEENIIYPLADGVTISHEEVGKYFAMYDGRGYVANKILSEIYPEDQPPLNL